MWVLDKWRGAWDYSNHDPICVDDSPLTPEEYAAMPDDLREIHELYDEPEREYNRRGWRDDDLW